MATLISVSRSTYRGNKFPPTMRLFSTKVPTIATECVRALLASSDIEAESPKEVEADVESVLRNYLSTEKEVNERAKDLLERTNRGTSEYGRVRAQIADSKGIKVGEETLDYHHSANVDEIFCEDVVLRRKMAPIFKKHMMLDTDLDNEVRLHLKNLKEGTSTWDIEYQRVLEQMKRKKGLA
jgi:hypothetical protein